MESSAGVTVETYDKIWLSDFFHDFPHWNFEFSDVNATFDPVNKEYQQACGLWGLFFVAVCFLLWLVFMIYFIFRCCQKATTFQQRASLCPVVFTGIFIAIGIAVLGYGFYENESTHQNVEGARRAVSNANSTIMLASERVQSLQGIAENVSTTVSNALEEALRHLPAQVQEEALKKVEQIRTEANSVKGYLNKIDINKEEGMLDDALKYSDDVEYYRWLVNIVVFCIFIVLFLMSFIGLLVKSKGVLMLSASLFVICSLFIWIVTGAYVSTSIMLGDLCVDPDTYFMSLAEGSEVKVAVKAYIVCTDTRLPYQQEIQDAQLSVSEALRDLNKTVQIAMPFKIKQLDKPVEDMRNNLQYATGNLSVLLDNVGICTTLHQDYVEALQSLCVGALQGTALLCLISCIVAVICTIIIFLLSCVWRRYPTQKRHMYDYWERSSSLNNVRAQYVPVDDSDPFLPKPPTYDQHDYGTMRDSTPRPWSERGNLQRNSGTSSNAEDQVFMLNSNHPFPGDESPPPAYYPGRYTNPYLESRPATDTR